MRYRIAIVLALCGLQGVAAKSALPAQESAERPPATRSDVLAETLWRIAVSADVKIGFEAEERTSLPRALRERPHWPGGTLTAALNSAVHADDRYDWRSMGGIIVVRPRRAWAHASPLNRQILNLTVTRVPVWAVLRGLHGYLHDNRLVVPASQVGDVSLRVDSGTVLDVLNQLTALPDQVMWVASYRSADSDDARDGLSLELRNAIYLTALISTPVAR